MRKQCRFAARAAALKILAVGQSPKTEFFWFETTATDGEGRQVSAMRMLLRFMKGSSELWA